jgi:arylsulfatase A-like enzyme
VDEGIQRIFRALGPRIENTLVVFMADNGWMSGAHRFAGKDLPYRRSTEVPMMMRWDHHIDDSVAGRLTTNIDLTATIAEAAGLRWDIEGTSVLSTNRRGTVLEQMDASASVGEEVSLSKWHPAYCGYRTAQWMYVQWDAAPIPYGEELYHYPSDPGEMDNLAADPRYQAQLERMRASAIAKCSPAPFGFDWS